jgi:arylsulfatase A-like enzyme
MDLTATIAAITNSPVPADAKLEGINLMPMLEGKQPRMERTLFWRYTLPARRQRAVRQGDWKLVLDGPNPMLFNLASDIGERNDLANQRPDIVKKLYPLIAQWEQDVDAEAKATAPPAAPSSRQ